MDNGQAIYLMTKLEILAKENLELLEQIKNDIYLLDPADQKESWEQFNLMNKYFNFSKSIITQMYTELLARPENNARQLTEMRLLHKKMIEYIESLGGDKSIIHWL
jgi:hypothetical protein